MNISWDTPGIVLKEFLEESDFLKIQELEKLCREHDGIALKLELEYKLSDAGTRDKGTTIGPIQEFMYYKSDQLVGYLGICCFGGREWEVSGMVHPDWRRQGIFSSLFRLLLNEREHQKPEGTLLLCDRGSVAGKAFIETTGAVLEHSEHEMYLEQDPPKALTQALITLRKADNSDAAEVDRQNRIYFNFGPNPADPDGDAAAPSSYIMMPEEEEKRGLTIYMAELDHEPVGKVHIQRGSEVWGIYGLGVLPEYRGQGFGRAILGQAVNKMKSEGAPAILLQVDAVNDRALGLYQSCGFIETSVMDYYKL